ncbi:MAG: DUF503 domain-containing protein [Bacillota bacterium]
MIVGTLVLRLRLPGSRSLKDKRQVLRSLCDRMRNRYGVSVAEIADAERHQTATLGIACVSGTEGVCRRLLDDLVRWAEAGAGEFEVVEATIELR